MCKGLRDLKAAASACESLEVIYSKYLDSLFKADAFLDLSHIVDYKLIETEDALVQNIANYNNANLGARNELMKVALMALREKDEGAAKRFFVDPVTAFDQKMQLLQKWEVPIVNKIAPVGSNFRDKTNQNKLKALDGISEDKLKAGLMVIESLLEDESKNRKREE